MYSKITRLIAPAMIVLSALSPITSAGESGDIDTSCFDPHLIDSTDQLSNPTFLTIRNNLAYIIDNAQDDLVIIDLTAPGFPILSRTSEFNNINSITLNDNTAYISRGDPSELSDDGFEVWDIQDPTDPWFIRPYDINSNSTHTIIHNNIMFHDQNLIMSVARQRAPRIEDSTTLPISGTIIHTNGNTAYTHTLAVLDITDPSNPIELSPPVEPFTTFDQILTINSTIIARDGSDFHIFLHTSPSTIQLSELFSINGATDFVARSSILFITAPDSIEVVDVSNPNDPIQIAYFNGQPGINNPNQIELIDNTFYITDLNGTLAAYEFNTNPVATHSTAGTANEIKVIGDLALIADDNAGMQIFDISNPQLPALLSTFPTGNTAVGIDAVGTVAYIATHQSGLDIVDISDPSNPTLITNYDSGRSTRDVQIVGDIAYVVDRIDGLNIVDISDPSNPQLISITDTPGWADDITVDGELAIIPQGTFDLQILDISDIANPQIIASITPLDPSFGLDTATIHAGLLYTCENIDGYRVWDISKPSSPIPLITLNTNTPQSQGFGHHIIIQGSRLLLANGAGGLSIYNNSDPLNPILTSYFLAESTIGTPRSSLRRIELKNNLAYAATLGGGLRIYDTLGCQEPCPADFNNDGTLNFFDISTFLTAFQNQDPLADLNADVRWNFFDISAFLTLFSQGCP